MQSEIASDTEAEPKQPVPTRKPAVRSPREAIQRADSSKPSPLELLRGHAVALGIRVGDARLSSGRIWVELLEPRDNTHGRLIRKTRECGFAFLPEKGYWK